MPKLSDKAEDVLESLWTQTEETDRANERDETPDLETLRRDGLLQELLDGDLVVLRQGTLELSSRGREVARETVRRHRLAERLLHDVLEIGGQAMDEAACGFEHSLQEGVDEAICTLLGHPRSCPHGRPIPPGVCCRDNAGTLRRLVAPLSALKPGEKGRIAYIQTEEARKLQKLMGMGVLPGNDITLLQRFPSYVFQVGHSQFAVDAEIAETVYVRL
ncbi:MAG: transcriptional regulator [Chloroflexota bacterium]|nr:MAG: transcriptional regulator [Chloroflexota bacterium]